MEVSDYLSLTPEQKQKRHSEWKERQSQIAAGEDPEEIKLKRRAKKALFLLKSEYNGEGKTQLSDGEIEILKAIVVEYCSSDLYFFSKYVLDFDLLTKETHKRWADNLLGTIEAGKKRVMRLKPRGSFKTTIYGVGFTLWLWACQSAQIRIFYTSSNALLLGEVSDKINQYVGDEKADTFFSFVFGIIKDNDAKNTSDVFNIKGRSGKGFSLILRTSGGSTVGIHPNVVIIDDPCFDGNTKVLTRNGYVPIKDIKKGDYALTRSGYKKVISSGITKYDAKVKRYNINGINLIMTPNHKVIVEGKGKVPVSLLKNDDVIIKFKDEEWKYEKLEKQKLLSLMVLSIGDTLNQTVEVIVNILWRVVMLIGKFLFYIERYGFFIMEKFRMVIMSIIKTAIFQTIKLKISKLFLEKNTTLNIQKLYFKIKSIGRGTTNISKKYLILQQIFISLKRAEKTRKRFSQVSRKLKLFVWNATKNFLPHIYTEKMPNIAQRYAGSRCIKGLVFLLTPTRKRNVYNITVEDCHEFVAEGLLVANCDQKDRESEAVREQKKRWLDSVTPLLVPFVSPRSKFLFKTIFYIGTVWHMQDLTYHIAKMNKKLKGMMKWDIEIESIYNDEGTSNYPEFMSDEEIEAIRSSISEEFFACQYMNKALPVGLQIFNMDKLSFAREDQVDIKEGQILCIFDPSLGKAHSDYPAVWWLHKLGDNLTFIEALDKKIELSLIVNVIAAKNVELGCREMVYEDNGVMLVGQALEKAHKRVQWHMEINSVHHSSNKHERIVSIQPDLYSGYVRFMEDYEERYPEAMNQIVFYPAYGHDDFPDAAHMGIEYFRQDHFKFHVYTELL